MDFFDLLVGVETDLWNRVESELTAGDQIGLGTLAALRVLQRHAGDGRVQDLSTALSITVGAASKLVDRLERHGLASRRPHPVDRRSSLVVLTTSGDTARVAAELTAERVLAGVIGIDADVAAMTALLERFRQRIVADRNGVLA